MKKWQQPALFFVNLPLFSPLDVYRVYGHSSSTCREHDGRRYYPACGHNQILAGHEPYYNHKRNANRGEYSSATDRPGEKAAVQECLSRYGGLVWSLARRFLGNATEAEDAVQDIFVELWKNADRYNPSLSSEPTYITMVTRRRLIDRRRKIVRRPELVQLPDAVPSKQAPGTNQVEMVDEASKAAAALQELRPEQQQVLKLAVYQGLTHEEISQSTGLPLGTVKTHARRGLIKLRELLGLNQSPLLGNPQPTLTGGL